VLVFPTNGMAPQVAGARPAAVFCCNQVELSPGCKRRATESASGKPA
jgi:hypothetical protein